MTARQSWTGIVDEVTRRIAEGEWPRGATIPNEVALAEEFGCSRNTVNRALRALAEQGVLDRRRKAGTRVKALPESRVQVGIPVVREQVERRGARYDYLLLERSVEVPPPVQAACLGLAPGVEALHLRCLHTADGHPFVYEDRWISTGAVPDALHADFGEISANEWLVANVPFTTGEIGLSAVAATADEAELLHCAEGAPLFQHDRVTRLGETTITCVRMVFAQGYRMGLTL